MNKLKEVFEHIDNEVLADLAKSVIRNNWKMFKTQPAGCGAHHAYEGGLLDHSCNSALLSAKICDSYPKELNKSLVVVGTLLHDIGKVHCYAKNEKDKYISTRKSLWHHHIPIGFHIVASEIDKIHGFDDELADHLLHIIISHHGRKEYSSPRTPQTDEAFVVGQADLLDAYMGAAPDAKRRFNK